MRITLTHPIPWIAILFNVKYERLLYTTSQKPIP